MWDTCTSHFEPKKFDRVGRGVREGQNIALNKPRFWLLIPLEAPKWVQDPGNGLKSIRGGWGDHLGSISGVNVKFMSKCLYLNMGLTPPLLDNVKKNCIIIIS